VNTLWPLLGSRRHLAGNDGASAIHTGGTLAAAARFTFHMTGAVVHPSLAQQRRFVLDVWLDGNLNVTAEVTSPNGYTYQRVAGEWGTSQTADGTIYVSEPHQHADRTTTGTSYCEVYDGTATPCDGGMDSHAQRGPHRNVPYDAWLASRSVGTALVTLNGATPL